MARPVHFEIPAENAERATKFFKDVFGWSFQNYDNSGYFLADTGKDANGINGAIMQRRDPSQPVVNTIDVPSIDEYAKKIEASGGTMVVPKMAVGDMGFNAYFKDTEGNIHGLWELAKPRA
jgi:predicted enzyme related to lactoylglutathione lyase